MYDKGTYILQLIYSVSKLTRDYILSIVIYYIQPTYTSSDVYLLLPVHDNIVNFPDYTERCCCASHNLENVHIVLVLGVLDKTKQHVGRVENCQCWCHEHHEKTFQDELECHCSRDIYPVVTCFFAYFDAVVIHRTDDHMANGTQYHTNQRQKNRRKVGSSACCDQVAQGGIVGDDGEPQPEGDLRLENQFEMVVERHTC